MRHVLTTSALAVFLAVPVAAQEEEDGLSLMERGAQMFFEGIMREMEPAMKDLRGRVEEMEPALREFIDEMGPALTELMGKIGSLSDYHPPEVLPNGDIILRKKRPDELAPDPDGEIEL